MDKQKQIAEMAKILLKASCMGRECENCAFVRSVKEAEKTCVCLKHLYNAGYRKINEGAVVLTKEEYEILTNDLNKHDYGDFENGYSQGYQQGSKETAEKFAEMLKAKLSKWLDDNEDLNFKIDKGIAIIELIGVETLEGEVIAESLIDEICKEITEGKV